jgi:hypothetical protein
LLHLAVPVPYRTGDLLPVACLHLVAGKCFGEGFERCPSVTDKREPRVFGGVEVRDVDVHETYPRVLERGL